MMAVGIATQIAAWLWMGSAIYALVLGIEWIQKRVRR